MKNLTHMTVESRDEALIYMTECTLATVCDLAGRARPPKGELQRQIAIAQTGMDALRGFVTAGRYCGAGRVQEIVDAGISVQVWAGKFAVGRNGV